MEKTIQKIQALPKMRADKRVAAYARVSTEKDAMMHSLSAQVSYYSDLIQNTRGWKYVGVYADEGLTGTKADRANFVRMVEDCKAGKIDIVITKSISRFARNTLTLLETVRELKLFGVDIYFEEQKIHSMSGDGELMLTILASYAQEESRSASENQKWRVQKNFQNGLPWNGACLGYHLNNGVYEITEGEDVIVKRIFSDYLSGMGFNAIAKVLNEENILTRRGYKWTADSVSLILRNYSYTGNLLLQSTYKDNYVNKRKMKNNGELPMYHAKDTHPAIIPVEMFEAVQAERIRRARHYYDKDYKKNSYPFTKKIICDCCGKTYRRKVKSNQVVWICGTYNSKGKSACPDSKQIPESVLIDETNKLLGLSEFNDRVFEDTIESIRACSGNLLIFKFLDCSTRYVVWKDRSRSESWTPEMKEQARQRARRNK